MNNTTNTDKKKCHWLVDKLNWAWITECKHFGFLAHHPREKDLKLYLTSAGDRRRTIHFIKKLLKADRTHLIQEVEKLRDKQLMLMVEDEAIPVVKWKDLEEILKK